MLEMYKMRFLLIIKWVGCVIGYCNYLCKVWRIIIIFEFHKLIMIIDVIKMIIVSLYIQLGFMSDDVNTLCI
jgi:hypothetical protein